MQYREHSCRCGPLRGPLSCITTFAGKTVSADTPHFESNATEMQTAIGPTAPYSCGMLEFRVDQARDLSMLTVTAPRDSWSLRHRVGSGVIKLTRQTQMRVLRNATSIADDPVRDLTLVQRDPGVSRRTL